MFWVLLLRHWSAPWLIFQDYMEGSQQLALGRAPHYNWAAAVANVADAVQSQPRTTGFQPDISSQLLWNVHWGCSFHNMCVQHSRVNNICNMQERGMLACSVGCCKSAFTTCVLQLSMHNCNLPWSEGLHQTLESSCALSLPNHCRSHTSWSV